MSVHRSPSAIAGVALLLLIIGCGPAEQGSIADRQQGSTPGPERYGFSGTVLESPSHGPELCMGGIAESFPPQCGGIPVVGWDWETVDGERSRAGTTWAEVYVEGTYDGERFTLTTSPASPRPSSAQDGGTSDFTASCDEPQAIDPSAEWAGVPHGEIPGLVATWVTDDRSDERDGPFVVNVVVRPGFASEAEDAVRDHWRGHLCVVERDQPLASELEEVQRELSGLLTDLEGRPPWVMYADERRGVVVAQVTVVDDELREAVDEEFGPGLVELRGRLAPVR